MSGGADSIALLRAIVAIASIGAGEGRIIVAHLNHQLRPGEADADKAFVVDLCRRLDVPCDVGRVQLDQTAAGDGLEAAARHARYQFLAKTAARFGARFVATAHTADDQAETVLHRIVRGTGVGGLAGMARARPLGPATLLRPLLGFHRAELLAYLNDIGQSYRNDSSNDNTRFTRNRIRHELLPQLAERYNSGVADALLRLGSLAGEVQAVIDTMADDLANRCVSIEGNGAVRIDSARLKGQPPYLVRELLMVVWRRQGWPMQAMGFAQWDLLERMIAAKTPCKQTMPGDVSAETGEDWLKLQRQLDSAANRR